MHFFLHIRQLLYRNQTSPNFPIQSLPCFPVPESSAKRETQSKKGGESVNLLFALFTSVISAFSRGREGWELGRRSRSLRSSPPALAPWICDVVLLLENRGMARESQEKLRTEREQPIEKVKDLVERTMNGERE